MAGHVFITSKYYERCLETGLFGVQDQQLNFLSHVREGDLAFIFGTTGDQLAGPLRVQSDPFHDEKPVWGSDKNGKANFPNRVRLGVEKGGCWEHDIRTIWSVLLKRPRALRFVFATRDRSAFPLLPREEQELCECIAKRGKRIRPQLKAPSNVRTNNAVDLVKGASKRRFSSEAKLEAALMKNSRRLFEIMQRERILPIEDGGFALNQVTLAEGGHSIDMLMCSGTKMATVELKKDEIGEQTVEQVRRYGEYWTILGLPCPKLVAIGATINPRLSPPEDVSVWTYQLIACERRLDIRTRDACLHSILL